MFAVPTAAVTTAAGGHDQRLVSFYAVSVFLCFLSGLLAMACFAQQDRNRRSLVLNLTGLTVVGFTLVVSLSRIDALVSAVAALVVAGVLHRQCVRAGRPGGIVSAAGSA